MITRLRNSRPARLLLVFFLVPVVIFANPSTAAAAGPWSMVTVSGIGPIPGVSCHVPLRQAGVGMPALDVGSTGVCYGLPDVSPGYDQPGEQGSPYTISVSGTDPNGSACGGSTAGVLGDHPKNGTLRVAGTIAASLISTGLPDCSVAEVCMTMGPGGVDEEACASASIPALLEEPPAAAGACPHGTPSGHLFVRRSDYLNPTSNGGFDWQWVLKYSNSAPPAPTTATWEYVVNNAAAWSGDRVGVVNSTEVVVHSTGSHTAFGTTPPSVGSPQIELYAHPVPSPYNWNSPGSFAARAVPSAPPATANDPFFGWTDANYCRFYFGEKILNFTGVEGDDPAGDGVGPVAPPPPTEEPEPTPPVPPDPVSPSDDLGWLGLIYAVLKTILTAITGLVRDLIAGITNALKSLFIPSEGFFDDQISALEDSMEGTTLGNYVDALGDITPAGGSGCAGPTVTLPMLGGGSFTPLSSCSGAMATAADASRLIIGVSVGLSAALAVVRIIGRGFGWDPTAGGGA